MQVLDIGCGTAKKAGAIGLDMLRTDCVDIIGDARSLPFDDESFDVVYSSHIIEHFSHKEINTVLKEWIRCLKTGGTLEIRCPWLRIRALLFFLHPSWSNMTQIYGGQDHDGNFHKCGFSFELLKTILEENGIKEVKMVKNPRGYKHIPFVPNSLHVRGVKAKFESL